MTAKSSSSISTAPGRIPFIGHATALLRQPLSFLSTVGNDNDLVRIDIGPFKTIAVCDPRLAKHVFQQDRVFDKGGRFYDLVKEVTGTRSMVVMAYDDHRSRRQLVQPAFHSSRFGSYAQVMTEQVDAVTTSWRSEQVIDLFAEMKLLTARVGLLTMFTYMPPQWLLDQALDDSISLMDGLFKRIVAPSFVNRFPIPENIRFNRANARLRKVMDYIIEQYRLHNVDCGDMLSSLLKSPDEDRVSAVTNTDIQDEVTVFFLASMETTASLLAWTFTELLRHPSSMDRLRHELDTVLSGRRATLADLPKLTFTRQVLVENLRLHPPVWMFTRIATQDTELADHFIPAGTTILLSPYIFHHRENVFPDADLFDPDRWAESRLTKDAYDAFMPFGFGARRCIGEEFSMTEAMLAVAHILQVWHMTAESQLGRTALSFVLSPRDSLARVTRTI